MVMRTTRDLCTTSDVARIFGVTMARVRAMARDGVLWHEKLGAHVIVFDRREAEDKAADLAARRAAGKVRGPAPGGFKADPPGRRRNAARPTRRRRRG